MKLIQMSRKFVSVARKAQVETYLPGTKIRMAGAVALIVAGLTITSVHAQTSSPLEILNHAPKVRIEDPTPTPRPTMRPPEYQHTPAVPYVPPRGGAPYIQPVPPAFTPYSGNSASGAPPVQQPYYNGRQGAATPPAFSRTPTPRPVLGPEDVDREREQSSERKGGIVRGLLRAIPFVGGDDEEEETTPTPAPDSAESSNGPIYRGYDTDRTVENDDVGPLLLPPGSTPLPPDPEPSSPSMLGNQPMRNNMPMYPGNEEPDTMTAPPILTPKPRIPQPIGEDMPPLTDTTPGSPIDSDRPVLTVKRESDDTTETVSDTPVPPAAPASAANPDSTNLDSSPANAPLSNPTEEKQPGVARPDNEPTPRPLEKATTSVLIRDSRPEPENSDADTFGPKPDATAISIQPYDPTAAPAADDRITSLTIKQSDLGMPNPAYEQNTTVLAEFQDAVRKARADDYNGAATAFREYALNHASSGLAPRAAFLSVIFESSRSQAKENMESLERLFPKSRYVKEARERRGEEFAKAGDSTPATAVYPSDNSVPISPTSPVVSTETPAEQIARLEKELTLAVGDPAKEPELRKRLGVLYLDQQEYERAYEVLRPAAEMAEGQKVNGEVMVALGRAMVARGETVQAISLYEAVEEKYPGLIESDAASAWSAGLAFEGAGRYTKARTLYNLIRQKWAGTAEAGWATARLNDLAALRR